MSETNRFNSEVLTDKKTEAQGDGMLSQSHVDRSWGQGHHPLTCAPSNAWRDISTPQKRQGTGIIKSM